MPVEINDLSALARLGPEVPSGGLEEAEIERIARRVIEILREEDEAARMARPDNSSRSILDAD